MTDDGARSRVLRRLLPRRASSEASLPPRPRVEVDPAVHREPESGSRSLEARSPEISALLADLDGLRLVLATDLGLAAAAVEADQPALAAEAVDADREELAGFERRSLARLRISGDGIPGDDAPQSSRDSDPGRGAAENGPAATGPKAASSRGRVLPLRRLLPAVPAFAAAALVGLLAGLVPAVVSSRTVETVPTAAAASYAELARLTRSGARPADLRAAAQNLHLEVGRLLPVEIRPREQIEHALVLLEFEAAVLAASEHRGELEDVIVESQRLWHLLHDALPAVQRTEVPTLPAVDPGSLPDPGRPTDQHVAPSAGRVQPAPTPTPVSEPVAGESAAVSVQAPAAVESTAAPAETGQPPPGPSSVGQSSADQSSVGQSGTAAEPRTPESPPPSVATTSTRVPPVGTAGPLPQVDGVSDAPGPTTDGPAVDPPV